LGLVYLAFGSLMDECRYSIWVVQIPDTPPLHMEVIFDVLGKKRDLRTGELEPWTDELQGVF
jgi:hypothetical protein